MSASFGINNTTHKHPAKYWCLVQVLLALMAVGRGGQGDLGQRIRDEILVVQSKNNAKVMQLHGYVV